MGKRLIRAASTVVVFDPQGEYGRVLDRAPVSTVEAVVDRLRREWPKRQGRVVFIPRAGVEAEELSRLSKALKQIQDLTGRKRVVTLLVEELNLSFPVTALKAEINGFAELCSRGRHYKIDLIGISQRPAEVSTRFRGNESERYIFPLADPRDLATASAMLGGQHKEALRTLKVHQYLRWRDGAISTGKNRLS